MLYTKDELLDAITKNDQVIQTIFSSKYVFKWAKLQGLIADVLYRRLKGNTYSDDEILIIMLCRILTYLALAEKKPVESIKDQIMKNFGLSSSDIKEGLELILKIHKDTIEKNFKENEG